MGCKDVNINDIKGRGSRQGLILAVGLIYPIAYRFLFKSGLAIRERGSLRNYINGLRRKVRPVGKGLPRSA